MMPTDGEVMFVMSNEEKQFGATALLFPELLKKASSIVGEEEEEERRRENLFEKLDKTESDFSSFCSIWGFSSIIYTPDYTSVDLGKEFVDEEIEKMEEFKEKMRKYVTLGGKPSLLNDVDEISLRKILCKKRLLNVRAGLRIC